MWNVSKLKPINNLWITHANICLSGGVLYVFIRIVASFTFSFACYCSIFFHCCAFLSISLALSLSRSLAPSRVSLARLLSFSSLVFLIKWQHCLPFIYDSQMLVWGKWLFCARWLFISLWHCFSLHIYFRCLGLDRIHCVTLCAQNYASKISPISGPWYF